MEGTPLPCCKLRETFGGQFGCCLPAYHVGEHSCTVVDVRRGSTKRWGHVVQLFCVKKVPKDETQNFEGKGIGRRLNEKLESWLSSCNKSATAWLPSAAPTLGALPSTPVAYLPVRSMLEADRLIVISAASVDKI